MKNKRENYNKVVLAGKLLRTKNFVLVTDNDATMSIKLEDNIGSVTDYTIYRAELESMKSLIQSQIDEMDKDMEKLLATTVKEKNKPTKKAATKKG